MSLEHLTLLAPPPQTPIGVGGEGQWQEVERALGMQLPRDYRALIDCYGAAEFGGCLALLTPFSREGVFSHAGEFLTWVEAGRQNYLEHQQTFGKRVSEKFPFACHPALNGLLAIGGTETGGTVYYLTHRDSEQWTVVIYDEEFYEFEHFPVSLTAFLVMWLSGEKQTALLADSPNGRD